MISTQHWFEVLTQVVIKSPLFRIIAPCGPIKVNRSTHLTNQGQPTLEPRSIISWSPMDWRSECCSHSSKTLAPIDSLRFARVASVVLKLALRGVTKDD
jgi:hypothetical protein